MKFHPKVEDLSTYLDSTLTPAESQRVEAHLELCDTCRHRLRSMRTVVHKLAALERQSPPAGIGNQIRSLSSLQVSRPTLVERLEEGAGRLNSENSVLPMFGVVVALIVIIYLLTWAFYREQGSTVPAAFESEAPVVERSIEDSARSLESSGSTQTRVMAGRIFDLVGDTWLERGVAAEAEVVEVSVGDPEVRQVLEAHPELRDPGAPGRRVRLRLEGQVVEIQYGAPE